MNPFMVWSQLERRKIISRFPDSHNAEISKSLGRTWRGLTPEERRPFLEEAERLKMLHSREFPQYKYQPRKKPRVMKVPGAKDVQQKLARKMRKSGPAARGRKTAADTHGAGVEESSREARRAQEELLDRLLDHSTQTDVKQEREEEKEELNLRDLDTLTELSLMELSQDPQLHCLAFRVRPNSWGSPIVDTRMSSCVGPSVRHTCDMCGPHWIGTLV